jgi:hypothetical protein
MTVLLDSGIASGFALAMTADINPFPIRKGYLYLYPDMPCLPELAHQG